MKYKVINLFADIYVASPSFPSGYGINRGPMIGSEQIVFEGTPQSLRITPIRDSLPEPVVTGMMNLLWPSSEGWTKVWTSVALRAADVQQVPDSTPVDTPAGLTAAIADTGANTVVLTDTGTPTTLWYDQPPLPNIIQVGGDIVPGAISPILHNVPDTPILGGGPTTQPGDTTDAVGLGTNNGAQIPGSQTGSGNYPPPTSGTNLVSEPTVTTSGMSNMNKWLLIGAVGVVAAILIFRKRK